MSDADPWERHAGWWQQKFTDGVDPEYEEQLLPLVDEYLAGATRVLDIGCGEGQVARRISKLGAEVAGIDPTAAQVAVARERGGGPRYARAGAEAMPLRDASFDAAVSCLVFEHLDPFEPAIAASGEEAVTLLKGGLVKYRAMVTDVNLKGRIDGWEVATQSRDRPCVFPSFTSPVRRSGAGRRAAESRNRDSG